MRDAVICAPLRTPIGHFGGVFRDVPAVSLAATVLRELVARTGLSSVDDVILGQCHPNGEAPPLGRVAALDAGLGVAVPGLQLDRRCGSDLWAVLDAAMRVQTGVADVVIAGGAESMSQVEHYTPALRWGTRGTVELADRLARSRVTAGGTNFPVPGGMVETAENLRREFGITREAQDALAVSSHQRAIRAQQEGLFDNELVPVGDVTRDEHPRADTTPESLARLRPVMSKQDSSATVTAGNASGQNDGAAVCVVTTRDHAEALGLRPLARLVTWAVAGVEPARMGLGPVPATDRALTRAVLRLADMDLIELNEAFAAQVLAVTAAWRLAATDFDRLNVNGSGISLGHPVGATCARVLTTLLHELDRRAARYALETMCIGGGQGLAAIFERVR
ncbi:acetyl-CoA C-acetyltransferase [Actinophytocola gossypii]|uniref:Probable acetyl-CoA acetyltransferase n=1 Tax=Actinophytocola gossypii TaxID=2812003 RepID=A0ABT2JLX1_9PSEU|nr:acetyl-CoA C-acetyltransferase [Actinophytocola gossypii]MCT2588279.1 acetyl-CoA C-acetyltransferase [Actinophytocola gossypii]